MRRFFASPAVGAWVGARPADAWVDDRLRGEPKVRAAHAPREREALRVLVVVAACWLLRVHEFVGAAFTTVHCAPATPPAGSDVMCTITTGALSRDVDLRVTQSGYAGHITPLDEGGRSHRIKFATATAGPAGVTVSHSFFRSTSSVTVLAGAAVRVEASCVPAQARPGAGVRCDVTPRDAWGNAAEVERPAGAAEGYFAVARVGAASDVRVLDDHVAFVVDAAAPAGAHAGVAVTLDGVRVESSVEVVGVS